MTGITHFDAFLIAGILLNITPGNDTIYILTKSIAQGRRAGIVSALGISTGSIFHTVIAALGLSVIIAKSILLYNIIKYIGAAYLIYIGIKMLRDKAGLTTATNSTFQAVNYQKIYREAFLTNILNPKVALFFIAFLPQFIDTAATNHPMLPFLTLGISFTITGTIWCFILATFAAAIFGKLKRNKRIAGYINKACGLTMIGLGIQVALSNRK